MPKINLSRIKAIEYTDRGALVWQHGSARPAHISEHEADQLQSRWRRNEYNRRRDKRRKGE